MAGSDWRPSLPGDRVMARCPEDDVSRPKAEYLLWPPIRDQLFYADAVTHGGQRVDFGDNAYAPRRHEHRSRGPAAIRGTGGHARPGSHPLAMRDRHRGLRAGGDAAQGHRRAASCRCSPAMPICAARSPFCARRVRRRTISASGCAPASPPGRRSRRPRSCAAGCPRCPSASRVGATPRRPRSSAIRWRA